MGCILGVLLDLLKLKQALWQLMQGLMSSTRSSMILLTHSGSTRFWRAMPTASSRPAAISSAAFSGFILPAQTTGLVVKLLICSTSERLQFSGI